MNNNITMLSKDGLNAKLAECYVTIDGNRYFLMQAKNIEINFEKTKSEMKMLGRLSTGHKTTGWNGTGSATMYYNMPIYRQLLKQYKDTGVDIYWEMQITNDDPESSAGRQTVILYNCNADGGILAKFDVSSDDTLEEEMEFTYEDFEMPETFKLLSGMQ